MRIQRILVPTEDRALTEAVLVHVEPLLRRAGAEAVFLRVVPPDPGDVAERTKHLAAARDDLARLCGALRARGLQATADWTEGEDPAETILQRAASLPAGLIVLATHTREDLARWSPGSITRRVLRTAPEPMLLFNPWNELSGFRKILVALDGSERAARILPLVQTFAEVYGSQVVLLRIAPTPKPGELPAAVELAQELEPQVLALQEAGVEATVRIDTADSVSLGILEAATAEDADLIAMTTHGHTALESWPFGSNSEKVFSESDVPVLLKRVATLAAPEAPLQLAPEPPPEPAPTPAPAFERVLVPTDGSRLATEVLHVLPSLLQTPESELLLLRVVPHHLPRAAVTAAEKELSALCTALRALGHNARRLIKRGDAAEGILAAARSEEPDLLAMSSHGRSGVQRWIRGSVAERVLRRSPVPLFLCNPSGLAEVGWTDGARVRSILVPLDGSDRAAAILPHVARLSLLHQAKVILLRIEDVDTTQPHTVLAAERGRLENSLGEQAGALYGAGVDVEVRATFGPLLPELLAAAGAEDLVAISTHGRRGVARWWFGSVAEAFLRRCRRPLLLVRAPR